jgi:cytochrome c553
MKTKSRFILMGSALVLLSSSLGAEDAKVLWLNSCATCHGQEGKGDTRIGQKLKVRDFSDPKVQEALKDDKMLKAIQKGIKEGSKMRMPASPKLSDEEIKTLIALVRSFKKNSKDAVGKSP